MGIPRGPARTPCFAFSAPFHSFHCSIATNETHLFYLWISEREIISTICWRNRDTGFFRGLNMQNLFPFWFPALVCSENVSRQPACLLTHSILESVLRRLCPVSKCTLKKCSEPLKEGKQTKIQMSKWCLGCGRFCHINNKGNSWETICSWGDKPV